MIRSPPRKRSIIETINDELKNICQMEHSRHHSFANFITNIVAGLKIKRMLISLIFPQKLTFEQLQHRTA